jgi:hypothetical protein
MTQQLKEKALDYFEQYPKEEVIYITTDGQVFLSANRHDAWNHQVSLKEGALTPVRRRDVAQDSVTALTDEEEKELAELEKLRKEKEQKEEGDLTPALSGGEGVDAASEDLTPGFSGGEGVVEATEATETKKKGTKKK